MADANTMSLTEACVTKLAKDAAQLSKLYADYSRPRDFKPGDFVNFHPSMRNRPNPGEHVLGIVTRVLSCPFYEDFEYHLNSHRLVKIEDIEPYENIGNVETVCNGCDAADFRGNKHKCLICDRCVLCDACYHAHRYPEGHDATHKTEESGPPTAANLRKKYEEFMQDEPLRPGDVVTWKEGFKNKNLPLPGAPAVVVEVLPNVIYDYTEDGSSSSYFREPYNIRLGLFNSAGTSFCMYYYDSRRFKKINV